MVQFKIFLLSFYGHEVVVKNLSIYALHFFVCLCFVYMCAFVNKFDGFFSITSALYSHGLKLIVEALRKPTNSKMYSFGVSALDQLKSSLKDLPKFCEIVLKLPFYHDLPSPLAEVSIR